jgi:thioesterase domain-containing protein
MLPSRYVVLDRLPLTPNGKVDRKALPEPKPEAGENGRTLPPRDELEASLVSIWERVLGVRPIGINEDFFELGGHSLMAAHMLSEVKNLTRKDLTLSVLFQGANIEYLAKVLRNGVPSLPHQTVIEIQSGESDLFPFFAIVSPGESALGYAILARHMGPAHTVYRVQGDAPIIDSARPYTAAEMDWLATHYIAAMRSVQPNGPYFFGGMCDGAHIALRMAQKLEQRGQEVGMLAILDTWVLEYSQRRGLWMIHYWSDRFSKFKTRPLTEQIAIISRVSRNLLLRVLGLQHKHSAWSEAYWPDPQFVPPTFGGRVTLFKRPKQPYYYVNDPEMGWGVRASGGVDVHVLAIHHKEMLREPHVELLAESLSQCLQKAAVRGTFTLRQDNAIMEPGGQRVE